VSSGHGYIVAMRLAVRFVDGQLQPRCLAVRIARKRTSLAERSLYSKPTRREQILWPTGMPRVDTSPHGTYQKTG
jgi:hypothetical protein